MALIGTQVAADRLGVTDRTIRNWIYAGRLKGYRIGPHILRVEESELSSLFQEVG